MVDSEIVKIIEEDILLLSYRSSPTNPITLEMLIAGIDARQRMLVTYEELTHALSNLFAKNKLQEITHLKYAIHEQALLEKNDFSGITQVEFDTAVTDYQRKMNSYDDDEEKEFLDDDDDEEDKLLTVVWFIGKRKIDYNIELAYNKVADAIEDQLDQEKYILDGFEHGYDPESNNIALWIYGNQEDNTQELHETIRSTLENTDQIKFGTIQVIAHLDDDEDQLVEEVNYDK